MDVKTLPKSSIPEWISHLEDQFRIFGPVHLEDHYEFTEVHSAGELKLDHPTTLLPPKKLIFPPKEVLLQFDSDRTHVSPVLDDQPRVIFGVHTCDLHAINILDRVFTQDYVDQHYLSRRQNTLWVSIECLIPCSEQSFCKDMGTLSVPELFDLHLIDIGDAYIVNVGSEQSARLFRDFDPLLDPTASNLSQLKRVMSSKWSCFPYRLESDRSELKSLLKLSYKSALWNDLGDICLGCGSCNLVCPTCYCFDVRDEIDLSLKNGIRYRVWDSCQLNQFATVAGGHDFRFGQENRQRHRFLRKYSYQHYEDDLLGCVGCGRCALTCPVNITPIAVINKLYSRQASFRKKEFQEVRMI